MITRYQWPVWAFITVLFLFLAYSRALTSEPWNDEAWYTAPSLNLILHGTTGTPILETTHKFWRGINLITYWVVPLQFFAQVPWIKLFGFGLVTMRSFAIVWGAITIVSWGYTTWKLTKSRLVSNLTMLLLVCDYQFESQVSLARMDAMALGCSSAAIALYILIRERSLSWALAASFCGVVASGLTHPTAGVPALAGACFMILALDRKKLRLVHILPAAVPFLLGAAFWGWYIAKAPDLFRAQFLGNVTDIDRLGGFTHPFRAIAREVGRYAGMAGFAPGMVTTYRVKLFVVVIYVGCAVYVALDRKIRERRGYGTLFGLWFTFLIALTFYENTKEVKYAIHIVALYDVLIALVCSYLLAQSGWLVRNTAVAVIVLTCLVGMGGVMASSWMNDRYHREYLPASEYLSSASQKDDLILAGSEMGFALGFDRNIVDDDDFLYYSRKQPKFIVISPGYRNSLRFDERRYPQIANYFENLVQADYERVYETPEYEIYRRKAST